MKKTIYVLVLIASLAYCQKAISQNSNLVVGYMPTYNNFPNSIYSSDLDILTHINIAFVNPDWNGNISMPNGTATVVSVAHAKNVKVLASICGGGGDGNTYRNILSNNNLTNTFIANLVQMCLNNNLDGIDVDIEGDVLNGTYVTAAQYENFIVKLHTALHAQNKLMNAALAGWFMDRVTNTAAQAFDLLGLMSYDAYGGWTGPGQHSPYSMAVNDFNQWTNNKGVDPKKILVGVPFYGYGWGSNQRAWPYRDVVNTFPGSENNDQVGSGANVIYYNGIPTIKQKTTFAKDNAAGVMIWELTQDISGTKSLLRAIGEVMGSKTGVPDNLAKNKTVTVSSTEAGNNIAANMTDGSYTTRWSSAYSDPQWAYVDLGDTYSINQVKITWEAASARNYLIQFSSNAQSWTDAKSISNNATLVNDHTGLTGNARYVRIYSTQRNTTFGNSIYELEVYGKALPKPYSGTAIAIPGKVEAELFDRGGQDVAYNDISINNTHGQLRTTEGVDIETCTDAGGGHNIGDIQAGEWTLYTINVTQTGSYDIQVRVTATASGKTMSIEMDGQNISGQITIPNTGGWQTWQTVTVPNVNLTAGIKSMRVVMNSELFNLNYIQFTPTGQITSGFVHESNDTKLSIYPNPSSGAFSYQLSSDVYEQGTIEILSPMGQTIHVQAFTQKSGIIHLDDIPSGRYLVKITSNNSSYIHPIMLTDK